MDMSVQMCWNIGPYFLKKWRNLEGDNMDQKDLALSEEKKPHIFVTHDE